MNNFDFTIGHKDVPVINLTVNGLSFNQYSIAALGYPEYVSIGLDIQSKKLGIKAIAQDDKSSRRYPFVTDEKRKKRILVPAFQIRAEIVNLLNIKLPRNGIKYIAEFDSDCQMLIVDLKKCIDK